MPGIESGDGVGACGALPAALEELCEALFEELRDALLAGTLFEEVLAAGSGAG